MLAARTALLAAAFLATAAPASGRPLVIGAANPVNSADPHFANTTSNIALAGHVFDRLVHQDAALRLQPGLALSWQAVSDTVWEFRLRPGVTWHDGRPFTADDVAFTLGRVPNVQGSTGGFTFAVRPIQRVEVLDALTLRFHTAVPHPLLPIDMAAVSIVSRHAGTDANPSDYNSGRAAIGTGPFRLVHYRAGEGALFTRNAAYWGDAPAWSRVDYRFIANDAARSAALLAGDVQLIDQVPSGDLPRLRREPRILVTEAPGVRVIFLQPDFSRTGPVPGVTDLQGQPLPRNPFLDLRVRQALSHAINRTTLVERVMEGTAEATGQWLPPGFATHNPDLPVPPYDPELARRLLAEAGYPEGFQLTLTGPNDRYPNDARVLQAVAQFWTRIGIRTTVEALPWAVYSPRGATQAFAVRLHGWGSSTGEASYLLHNILGTYDRARGRGGPNHMRYSNPALDALTERALATLEEPAREALLRQATAVATADLGLLPLFQLKNIWAARRGYHYTPRADEKTLAQDLRPAE